MARGRKKKTVVKKDITTNKSSLRTRPSSMKVNLSYVSNMSELENSSLKKLSGNTDETTLEELSVISDSEVISKKPEKDTSITSASVSNATVVNKGNCNLPDRNKETDTTQRNSLQIIKEKEQQLNRTCMQLKNAIMNKTQALFDKENELARKTTEILAAQYSAHISQTIESCQEDNIDKERSPSIRIDIGKNNQIIMSGDGRKKNPVQVLVHKSPERGIQNLSQNTDEENMGYSQSIASTPKQSRLESSKNDKEFSKISDTLLKIPVARLFVNDNDPNNSMCEINNLVNNNINSSKRTDINNDDDDNNISNSSQLPQLNYSTSPILSQGTRRSRFSRLSLKKRSAKVPKTSLKLSSYTSNESFINELPISCSSFIERDKTNRDAISKTCTTINLAEKSNENTNCRTINLEDNENSKTINIENSTNSTKSCMEITTVSSQMPIIRRSFQNVIRKSLKLENVPLPDESIQNLTVTQKLKSSSSDQSKKSSLNNQDCSANTVRTSLNVNTSLDQINSVESIVQKENQTPNNLNEINNKNIHTDEVAIVQCQSTCTVRTSMQVNTSLDSVRKSIVPISVATLEQNKNNKIVIQISNTDSNKEMNNSVKTSKPLSNQEKEYSYEINCRQPSISTIRSSLQVNTSLDSARKSPNSKNLLDYNKVLLMVEENNYKDNQSDVSDLTSKNQSLDSDNELENMSLIKRIKNLSTIRKNENSDKLSKSEANRKRKSNEVQDSASKSLMKSAKVINAKKSENRKSDKSGSNSVSKSRKLTNTNTSCTINESDIIETTPYPISRSVLMKTMVKNSIAMNTLDLRKLIVLSSDDSNSEYPTVIKRPTNSTSKKHQNPQNKRKVQNQSLLSDTVILSSTDELSSDSEQEKEPVIIEESLNESGKDISKTGQNFIKESNKKEVVKRKLFPLRENSQLISFSPSESFHESPKRTEIVVTKTKRKRKQTQKHKEENKEVKKSTESVIEREFIEENKVTPEVIKPVKRKKKITSKKIVVKKVRNISIVDTIIQNDKETPQRLSDRNSLREFDLRKLKQRHENSRKNSKIIIVVTGLSEEEKDLVKSVIKALGSATLEVSVTSRTTHVISSGVRTINLLKGIIRGCWLLSTEWALKSLESKKWLNPAPYEMCHFSKAVQENRRDRQLFGKAYVPELFVTCGFIYIENGTSPPAPALKELVKTAGGRITEDPTRAEIVIGLEGLKEIWILDSITTGEAQPIDQYKRN